MKVPLLRLSYSDAEVRELQDELAAILRSNYLTMASRVKEFERLFAGFCGTRFALGTNSGTSALEIPLRALRVAGGSVVMPSNTYMATPIAAVKAGAKVIFTDCEADNLQMDPDDLDRKIRDDTRAVLLVHIGGIISPRLEEIQRICARRGVPLVEDAAHAHGAEYRDRRAGSFGEAAGFSFYPTKVLTTAEGGMMTTDREDLYQLGTVFREHGKADHGFNVHTEIGDNWRFSEIHAALGIQQMRKADSILAERRRLAALYDRLLDTVPEIRPLRIPAHVRSAYYKYIVFLPAHLSRDRLKSRLKDEFGVMLTGEVYSDPCHSQPVFTRQPELVANAAGDRFPATETVCRQHACLPLYPGLRDEEAAYVVQSLKQVLVTWN
ncbi:MAG: hypothetical protein A3K19_12965 [Lentisphaerae bacterium RIFOXYB12_FULL_65_16]|nr:MAG: hypothetical protein A3K18_04740 [Lentisphaerae bacterium RIFOXYA12_64_32]OGV87283.1 MAG: hypothetical protein A3K19_12965 [Lentisphaerae bacterium RIFOXYB12_FULL_65_16]